MNGRLLAALIGIFAVGLLVGAVVGAAVSDSSESAPEEEPVPAPADCDAASAVVDGANGRFAEINESGAERNADFFGALMAEQLAIVYAMEAEPTCFSLAERADAAGLAGGLEVLALTGSSSAAVPIPVPAPDGEGTTEPGDAGQPGE